MPYISQAARDRIDRGLFCPTTSGELNYFISDAVDDFLHANGINYATINSVIGVLECAKLELYRRIAAPYEDVKLKDNGDVYTAHLTGDK